jgi:hypothetical protein
MKTRDGRLIDARFADISFTLIRAEFKDYDKPEGDQVTVKMYTYDPKVKVVKEILKEFPLIKLEENYANFNKIEEHRARLFGIFLERHEEITEYINSGITPEIVEEKPINLQTIKEIGNNAEDFFKLKLEIFELEEVKNSKNRKWKASMRKATTTLELLSLLYEVYSTVENEQGERLDETLPQETATPQDSSS